MTEKTVPTKNQQLDVIGLIIDFSVSKNRGQKTFKYSCNQE